MKTIIIFIILILLILILVPSKEKFYGRPLYPGIHNYYKDSYKYGLNGTSKANHLHFNKFSDFIPIINHLIL